MPRSYVERILKARVYDVAEETRLDFAPQLSRRLGNQVFLKREDLQPVFSFKVRGAHNRIFHLSEAERQRGVIAASAGNHGQGVALAAGRLGLRATIVMPRTTPTIKVDAVKNLGAKAVLHGDTYDEAYRHTQRLVEEKGLTLVHPYDDPLVIAGQGTVGMEILHQHANELQAIFVPVGGGGLIAGIGSYVKYVRPEIRVVGVEPVDAASMTEALRARRRIALKEVGLFADGVAVRQVGKETFRIARRVVDEMVLVSSDEICAAIKDVFDDTRNIVEPAGALALAGLKRYVETNRLEGVNLVAVNSGANMNFDRLRHVSERAELGEHREALFAATIPERPGSFRRFCKALGPRMVTEFNYRYSDDTEAHVFVGIQLERGEEERNELFEQLHDQGYAVLDMSENEMAKLHIRHLVGGRAPDVENERLFRFEFPERPGALLRFLNRMGRSWNISLFHYRNQGDAYGRVLAGLQVPRADQSRFRKFLDELGYTWREETGNPAYRLFL